MQRPLRLRARCSSLRATALLPLATSFAISFSIFALGLSAHAQEETFADTELTPLGATLVDYVEARTRALDVASAAEAVAQAVVSLRADHAGEDPLHHPESLRRALRLAKRFPKSRLAKGKVREETLETESFRGAGLALSYRLPQEYLPEEADYPLVLAIPDVDETPSAHLRAHWMSRDVRKGAIVVVVAMPEDAQGWDRVMVRGRPGGLVHVLTALRFATERFAVDPDRIFVSGRGRGARAALACGNFVPQRFAGVLVRSGEVPDTAVAGGDAPAVGNYCNVPTCFAEAGEGAQTFVRTARAAGLDNAELLERDDDAALWMWMRDHPRRSHPDEVRVVTGGTHEAALTSLYPFPTRAHWMQLAPSAAGAHAEARVDREHNAIDVTTEGVSHVTLFLDGKLVDFSRELTVTCDGVERRFSVEPHVPSMLDMLFDGTSDPGCTYVARIGFAVNQDPLAHGVGRQVGEDEDFAKRLAAAGEDADQLWTLHQWAAGADRPEAAGTTLRRLLRLHPDHAEARAAAGHFGEPGRWFSSRGAWERFQRGQQKELAEARGHVLHRGLWMHPSERSLASRGQVKDVATGRWLKAVEARRLSEGWTRQDDAWIEPSEASHADAGSWLVDGEWTTPQEADARRARIDSMWRIPGGEVELFTTVKRAVALEAAEHMGRAIEDLTLVFGAQPPLPLPVALLQNEGEYDRFAFGEPDGRRLPTHAGRLHVLHHAFFAESWFPYVEGKRTWRGLGVGLWDANAPNGNLYGVHAARLAAAYSYIDALDPSPKAVRRATTRGREGFYAAFAAEKTLPDWLRIGGAVYAERYFRDRALEDDVGDPWWARGWSLQNLKRLGGLAPLDEVFACPFDPDDRDGGQRLFLELGLLVAFVVDGDCEPVREAHAKLKHALVAGGSPARHVEALREAIVQNESALRAFAGE